MTTDLNRLKELIQMSGHYAWFHGEIRKTFENLIQPGHFFGFQKVAVFIRKHASAIRDVKFAHFHMKTSANLSYS